MRGTNFVPCSIDLLYYNLQKVDLKRSRSYIYSPEQLENKKTTINTQNNDDNCFQYALTVALNHQHKSSDYDLCRLRMFTTKNTFLSK